MNWNTITRPKDEGGTRIRNLEIMNKACMSKLGWKLHNEGDELWWSLVWGKYGRGSNKGSITMKATDSSFWKKYCETVAKSGGE